MNSNTTTHLVLISRQAVPNFTPVLDQRFRPQRVVMLISPDMRDAGSALEKIYRPRGIDVVHWDIVNPWDIEHIRGRVMDLLDDGRFQDIVLNATGGTKPMSIAAYEVFRDRDLPIFYVHPEKDSLIWLYPKGPTVDLADRIKIKEYLQVHGASKVVIGSNHGVPQALRDLSKQIVQNIERYADVLGTLNYLALMADNRDLSVEVNVSYRDKPMLWELLELFSEAGHCTIQEGRLQFFDEDARFLANGGWLELYTYGLCRKIYRQAAMQDLARNVEITRSSHGKTVLNEIDVAMLKDNRLYIMECKTKRYKGHDKKHDEGAEVLYKLDSLRDLIGGLQARAMLVSFNRLSKHNRDRATELNVGVCCHRELKNLEHKLTNWLAH